MIFSDSKQVKAAEHLFGDDLRALVDQMDEVSFHTTSYPKEKLIMIRTLAFCRSGVGWSHAADTQEVSALPVHSLQPGSHNPQTPGNPTLL
jgi:hypothetical protein